MILCNECGNPISQGAEVCAECGALICDPSDLSVLAKTIVGGPWKCPHCNEQIDDELDVCWNCLTPRDGSPPETYFELESTSAEFAALQEKMSVLPSDELLKILNFDSKDYRKEALEIARRELSKRGYPGSPKTEINEIKQKEHGIAVQTLAQEVETELWASIKDGDDPEDFREYIENYPDGIYAILARHKLRKLGIDDGTVRSDSLPPKSRMFANSLGIEFVWISSGSFMMGSANGEPDEKPIHLVKLSRGFFIGRYQVTQEQWRSLTGNNPSSFRGNKLPVESVSWNDVQDYVNALNLLNDGYDYRLPTEAEWEYACRAGTRSDYAGELEQMGWFAANSGNHTHDVGSKRPNAWGLFDMHGNVSEWCQDLYDENYYSVGGIDPQGAITGEFRVLRGGSWDVDARLARSGARDWGGQDSHYGSIGIRLIAVRRTFRP